MTHASRFTFSLVVLVLCPAMVLQAGETTIDITRFANAAWTALTNGSTFPTGNQNLGGVPFVIPSGANNWWSAAQATNFGSGTTTLTVPVGVAGVTSVFTLINTECGQSGPQSYISITFRGDHGAKYTKPLVGGIDTRDYNNDGCENVINNTTTMQIFSNNLGQRLDRQEFILPPEFSSQILLSVTITDSGNWLYSRAIFAGLTVCTCLSYVAPDIQVTTGSVVFHPVSQQYTQDVFITNGSSQASVNGPVFLVLENLSSSVTVKQGAGQTTCYAPIGSPYVIAIPKGHSLPPLAREVVTLIFENPSGVPITYTPLAVSSLGPTP